MTDLRTGAALVRALLAGDETARGVLADWLEQNGPLGTTIDQWVKALRRLRYRVGPPPLRVPPYKPADGVQVYIGYGWLLGTWPAEVWDATG